MHDAQLVDRRDRLQHLLPVQPDEVLVDHSGATTAAASTTAATTSCCTTAAAAAAAVGATARAAAAVGRRRLLAPRRLVLGEQAREVDLAVLLLV